MLTLPVELRSYIVKLACCTTSHGEQAYLALSLTNSDLASLALPFRFYSVTLNSPSRLLLPALESTPPHLLRIRHLSIAECSPTDTLRIISLSSPTLETLSFRPSPKSSTHLISHLFSFISFPKLTDLSIHGFYPYPSTVRNMPKLQRLTLAGNRNPHGLLQLGSLSTLPALEVLRIESLSGAVSFVEELCEVLLGEEHKSCPPSLEKIIVQPGPQLPTTPARLGCLIRSRGADKDALMMDKLRALDGAETKRVRFTLLERSKRV